MELLTPQMEKCIVHKLYTESEETDFHTVT